MPTTPTLTDYMRNRNRNYQELAKRFASSPGGIAIPLPGQSSGKQAAQDDASAFVEPPQDGTPAKGAEKGAGGAFGVTNLVSRALEQSQQALRQGRDQQQQDLMQELLTSRRERTNAVNPLEALSSALGSVGGSAGSSQGGTVTGENGRLDTSQLVDADGSGNLLTPAAASAWQRMAATAAQEGITLTIGNSYRTFEQQVALAEEKGLYSQGGLAATPGTSNHGLGLAVDVGEGPQRAWLARNAGRFGYHTIPREPWHFEYRG